MIADLKPYPAMKDSGVEWLGAVPEHWEVRRLRNTSEMRVSNVDKHAKDDEQPVRLCNYVDVYKNERIRSGMAFMRATATTDEIERFRLQSGDVLITKDSEAWNDIGVPALVEDTQDDIVSGYHLALLRPFPERVDGGYLFRALQSTAVTYQFHVEANGVTRYGLSHSAIKSVWLPLAPLPEQAAIVRYLDHADRRIRRYIRAKQKLIKLLEEQKQAIIHQAVTGQVDVRTGRPYPAYKPSGVEWLGDVPEHWEVRRCGRLFREVVDTGYPDAELLSIDRFAGVVRQSETGRKQRASKDRSTYKRVRPGQFAYNLMNAFMGSIGVSVFDGVLSPAYAVAEPLGQIDAYFFHNLLRTSLYTGQYYRYSYGIMYERNRLYFDRFKQIPMLVPPYVEQKAIVASLTAVLAEFSRRVECLERQIELITEHRTRLITDVVTGKLDVREVAAGLPDEAEGLINGEEEPSDGLGTTPEEAAV